MLPIALRAQADLRRSLKRYNMRKCIAILLFLSIAVGCLADDLITSLDAGWNRHDYPACRRLIQSALQKEPSNVAARVAMAAYHGWVEFDLAAATTACHGNSSIRIPSP